MIATHRRSAGFVRPASWASCPDRTVPWVFRRGLLSPRVLRRGLLSHRMLRRGLLPHQVLLRAHLSRLHSECGSGCSGDDLTGRDRQCDKGTEPHRSPSRMLACLYTYMTTHTEVRVRAGMRHWVCSMCDVTVGMLGGASRDVCRISVEKP